MKFSIYHPLLLLIVTVWGFNIVAIKYLVHIFAPMTMTSLRIFIAGSVILLFLRLRGGRILISPKQFMQILVISFFGVVGHHAFLSAGLHQTPASNAGVILGLVPLVTSLFSILSLNVRTTISKLAGFLIGFLGVTFIILKNPQNLSFQLGDLYIFLCVVSQGFSFVLLKKAMHSLSPAILTGWMFTLGSFGLFMISIVTEPAGIPSLRTGNLTAWLIFLSSAIFATASGHFLYNKAMQKIGSVDAAIFINLSPCFTLLGSSFFLGETIYFTQIMGFLCVVMGVLLGIGLAERSPVTHNAVPSKKGQRNTGSPLISDETEIERC